MSGFQGWFDRQVTNVGLLLMIVGGVLFIVSLLGVIVVGIASKGNLFDPEVPKIFVFLNGYSSVAFNSGSTALWVGAILYAIGRFLAGGLITIVGFEHTPPSKLLVKGPDEQNYVWIGKPYANAIDAELAAKAFSQRLGGRED